MPLKLLRRTRRPHPDEMTLMEHLGELRRRLVISILAITAGGVISFFLYPRILKFFEKPYCQILPKGHSCTLYVVGPLDGFSIRIKIAGYCGIFLSSPVVLWQVWRFITPGLKKNEKKYAIPFIVSSIVLFAAGAVVAYEVFAKVLRFLTSVGGPNLQQIYTPNNYLSLIVVLMVAFGVAFEFPVVLVSLELANVLKTQALIRHWRVAVIGIWTVAAIFIPSSDPYSLVAMALPMCGFYFGAIGIGKLAGK